MLGYYTLRLIIPLKRLIKYETRNALRKCTVQYTEVDGTSIYSIRYSLIYITQVLNYQNSSPCKSHYLVQDYRIHKR